jgi:hypothetical protein
MSTTGPPQGGFSSSPAPGPPAPVAVQQTTVIQVGGQKSVVGAVLLAFFFGPLGMLYATVPGALIMFVISFPILFLTLGLGLILTLPACAIWAGIAASSHNNQLQAVSGQQAVVGHAAISPPGWHDDPGGSGRLRYYDGMRWTDHYAESAQQQPQQPATPADPPAKQLDAPSEPTAPEPAEAEAAKGADEDVEEAEVVEPVEEPEEAEEADAAAEAPTAVVSTETQQVFCGSCGHNIAPTARFCSACGETQATA